MAEAAAKGDAQGIAGQMESADQRLWRWLTLAPALLMLLALSIVPLVGLVLTSFQNIAWAEGRAVRSWAGLDHYRALFSDALFGAGLWNTGLFALGAVTGQMLLGFALALLVSKVSRARVLYRTIFILPILIPGIVIGAIWKLILNFDFGLANQILGLVGLGPVDWLGDGRIALLSVIMVDIWHWTPFCFLLFLAGLESLPQDVYEATKIDGASAWQELLYVTLPLMVPTIVVTFAFRLVLAFKVFDEVYLLTKGGPGTATEVISFTLYQRFFTEDKAGYGSAMSVTVIFLVCLLLAVALSARRRSEGRA
ncbi:Transcriptional regulator [Bosea sp. 62]|uniref:carbohydrate ABC transporter permease n=1 Tax=unclassified Bosea (in: a-proteobacteria) TaxID=2653178 RepID=UPI001259B4EB|nr:MULTISPECIES: sugar ABC transporter permease [unclassified Bosea (in: a-proteobacteria)]CAD5251962.1 Transcriptional regulator [Bosea sp. 21B]CAD5261208.1 Transcriptional regulator [Bosea sp. 7B]CAD5273485.1 Transcriptional regulator [Bosea sp. 46]VVT43414.1 Transcriptional regulator [Bosea sp. EC-HK365B]VXB27515.1 Transcriptional regulator [Bosea sp. 29B]